MAALIRAAALPVALASAVLLSAAAFAGDALAAPGQAFHASPAVERWRPYIAEASHRFGVSQAWIAAVMQAESAGLTHLDGRPITSRAGAMGLMQVMPGTYAAMRARHHLGPDAQDPHDNIMAGAAYLRAMHDRFGYPGLFAAYNAGPERYANHLRTGTPLAGETRDYIAELARAPAIPAMRPATLSGTRLFVTLGGMTDPAPDTQGPRPAKPAAGGLFVPLDGPPGGER